MVIRRHAILLPAEGISHAVIAHIDHDIEIISPDRLYTLYFPKKKGFLMAKKEEKRNLETIPVGSLGVIAEKK